MAERPGPRDITVDTPAGRYGGIDYGGTGQDIVLIHQVTANAQVWAPLAAELTTLGHVVAVDLRGHGRTEPDVDDPLDIARDLPAVVAALGLVRPLVVAEGLDVLALDPHAFDAADPLGYVIIGDACGRRGEDARSWYAEQYDDDAVDVWVDRFELFASGHADEKEAFLERVTAAATSDWLTSGVEVEQWRAYLRRAIHDSGDRWQRRPTRTEYSAFTAAALDSPMGLDLYARLGAPTLLLDSAEQVSAPDLVGLRDFCATADHCEMVVIDGGGVPELLSPEDVTREVGAFVRRRGAVRA